MKEDLRVLILEDLPTDAELAKRELKIVLTNCTFKVVDTEEDFVQALKIFKPNLIISDYLLPEFDGLSALKIRQDKCQSVPFVMLTGSVNEETAVECMKAGADDYVIKEHIKRLGSAALNAMEKKKIEQKREWAEVEIKKLGIAIEQSPVSIIITDPDGTIEYVNPNFEKLTGYSSEEAIGKKPNIIKSEVTPDSVYKELWDTIKKGETWVGEFVNKKKNGELYWESATISVVLDDNNNITNFLAIKVDITENKRIIDELMEREEKFRTLTQNLNVGVYRNTPGITGIFLEVNPAFLRIFGFRSKNELERFKVVDLFPDPYEQKRIEEKLTTRGFLIDEEIKLRKKDGTIFFASMSATLARDDLGKVMHYDGIVEDITGRKQTEEEIRRLSKVFLDGTIPTIIEDLDGIIQDLNDEAVNAYGWTREELIGKPIKILVPEERHEQANELLNRCKAGEQIRNVEGIRKKKDGTEIQVLLTLSLLTGEGNTFTGIATVATDISERELARKRIALHQENLAMLSNELTMAEEKVRRRLAISVHDKLGQSLALANFKINELNKLTKNSEHKKINAEIISFIAEAINESRNITYELSPPVLYEMGLTSAISWKLDDIEKNNIIKTSLTDQSKSYKLEEKLQIILYRTINELLQNVIKHSKADNINVSFKLLTNDYRITVADNGIGFDLKATRDKAISQKKFGLFSIIERIKYIGGTVEINTAPNRGTKTIINMPIKN